jgi:hypothetical protein
MRNRSFALGAGVLATLALVACGDSGNSADEDQISAAITRAATSGDPAACTEVQTQKFIEQTSGGASGEAAIKQCEKDADQGVADKIDATNIEVDGDSATANAAVTGSIFDGQTLQVALVNFNRDAMNAAFTKEISSDPQTPPAAVDCVTKQIEGVSDEQLQSLFLGDDPKAEEAIFGPCSNLFKGA